MFKQTALILQIKTFRRMQEVIFQDMGLIPYREAWDYQEKLLQRNVQLKTEARTSMQPYDALQVPTKHYFLICEHPPVYTLGKSGDINHVLLSEAELKSRGIEFHHTNRGGDITFHGLQQVVGYPILDLEKMYTDIGRYLRNLEEVIIRTIAEFGLKGSRSSGETGVWIDPELKGRERKICAIGVRCSRWVTMHGFALNVNTDLNYFNHIIPCGIQNKQVTSIEKEVGERVDYEKVKKLLLHHFEEVFEVSINTLRPAL
ncbi:MAG TPA: lipoyl(octanoyl) transferase LipB [Ferruginibacter sp.]|nr:lipoyl(octanoyl) transferase LipB [Ferruginibacter sp.]